MRFSRLALHPDLDKCILENRVLLAYSPTIPGFILTTGGYTVLTVPPGLSSALNTMSSSPGSGSSGSSGTGSGSGGNMPTSFNVIGFGSSTMSMGNVTGNPNVVAAVRSSAGAPAGGGGGGGGGASSSGPSASNPNSAGAVGVTTGYGAAVSSGFNTALNSANSYGMTSSPVGSIPVQTFANASSSTPVLQASGTGAGNGVPAPAQDLGPKVPNLFEGLLGKKLNQGIQIPSLSGSSGNP